MLNKEDINNKSSISDATSYEAIGEFWDERDTADYWEQTYPVEFDIDLTAEKTYYSLDRTLAARVQTVAAKQGVSSEMLSTEWILEKLQSES